MIGVVRAAWGVLKDMLKGIPWQVYAAVALAVAFLWWGKHNDREGYARAQAEIEAEVRVVTEERIVETVRIETQYVDRIKEVKVKGDEIIREVPVFVRSDEWLSGGFRLLHDAAARNAVPDTAGIADAAPVAAQDAAATVADNYTDCNVYTKQLNGWIDWAEAQCRLNKRGCT